MSIFQSLLAVKVIFVFGIINIVTGVMVVLSCRCFGGAKIGNKLMKYASFQRFYKYHCYIWWVFWISVIVHAVFAIGTLGSPF